MAGERVPIWEEKVRGGYPDPRILALPGLERMRVGMRGSGNGQLIHSGHTVALWEAFLFQEESEQIVAHGTSRCLIRSPIDPIPVPPDEWPLAEGPLPGQPEDPFMRQSRARSMARTSFSVMTGSISCAHS
jgi:hypothetical protein